MDILYRESAGPIRGKSAVSRCRIDFLLARHIHGKSRNTGCNRRKGPDLGRVFLMLNYTEKPQNTYIQS